ncbi:MAG: tetratricopeptide repeat protein, partial [Wenzhouxiangellaceae bacterium]
MNLLSELKRRNVIRSGLAWLALSWLLVAIADLLFPYLGLPDEAIRGLILGLLLALIPVLVLAWMLELTPRGLRRDRGPSDDNPENVRTGRRIDQVTIVVVLLALGVSAVRQFVVPEAAQPPEPEVQVITEYLPDPLPPPPPGPVEPRSLAVMPFVNLSPDPANAYLAEGMAEELLNVLARIDGLKVASRTSSFSFKDASVGGREIGRRLGVAHLVDGSLRRQGDSIRVTAQLVRAADDRQLWSGSFDRELTDIFTVQEEIAQAVADALADTLGVRTVRVREPTSDLQAYELYLRGRLLFAQRGDNLIAARELLEQAVARDPRFADAWAALAGTWFVLPSYFAEYPAAEAHRHAYEAAQRAQRLVSDQPAAQAVSARLIAERGQRLEAIELLETASARDPNNANTWMWKGLTLLEAGHVHDARGCFERARDLDPLTGIHYGWLGATDVIAGNVEAAEQNLARAHALGWRGPASGWRLKLALADGPGPQAAERYEDWVREDGRIAAEQRATYHLLAPALTEAGARESALELLEAAVRQWPQTEWTHPYLVAGLTDAAIDEALRRPA